MKKTAVVVAPGRGTYNKAELGYLQNRHTDKRDMIAGFDAQRVKLGQPTLSDLDSAPRYDADAHTRGDNASALIYACAFADFLSIDPEEFEIVAVTGNSMGWYIALACAGALNPTAGFELVNTMGTLMHQHMIGGQIIYPYTDSNWVEIPGRKQELLDKCAEISARPSQYLDLSIDLGGLLVLAGNTAGLARFEEDMPRVQDRFPMRLPNHAGFHTSLQTPVAEAGRKALDAVPLAQPDLPLIDGRGGIWHPKASDLSSLWDYTLDHQVTEPYDFATAIRVAAREFCPDCFLVLGPGTTLSGSVAQSLIRCQWRGWTDKSSFQSAQKETSRVVAFGA
jgi:[acyl-carrier-protein] S-malonyltransferase